MKIVGIDNLNRETVADRLVVSGFPEEERERAQEFCDWMNSFSCHDGGGTFYCVKPRDYRLSRGMSDIV